MLGPTGEFTQPVTIHDGSNEYQTYAVAFMEMSDESSRGRFNKAVTDRVLVFDAGLLSEAGLNLNSAMTVTIGSDSFSIRRVEPKHAGRVVAHIL